MYVVEKDIFTLHWLRKSMREYNTIQLHNVTREEGSLMEAVRNRGGKKERILKLLTEIRNSDNFIISLAM